MSIECRQDIHGIDLYVEKCACFDDEVRYLIEAVRLREQAGDRENFDRPPLT